MPSIIQEFEAIDSEVALRSFLQKNGFRMADSRSHADQYVLGAFIGKIGPSPAKVTHRLFDEKSASLAGLPRNQIILEVDGSLSSEVRFRGQY